MLVNVTQAKQVALAVAEDLQTWALFNEPNEAPLTTVLAQPPTWLFAALLFGYCSKVVGAAADAMGPAEHASDFVRSLVVCCLSAFGGSFINPALLDLPAPPIVQQQYIGTMCAAWWCRHNVFFGRMWSVAVAHPGARHVVEISYEVFRCWVMFAWYGKAVGRAPGQLLGPVICGTLGGSGGAFLPFTKGLGPLEGGAPWNVESAFVCILVYHLCAGFVFDLSADQLGILRLCLCAWLVLARLVPKLGEAVLAPVRRLGRVGLGLSGPVETGARAAAKGRVSRSRSRASSKEKRA